MTIGNRVSGVLVGAFMMIGCAASGSGDDDGKGGADGGVVPPADDGGMSVVIAPDNLIDDLDDGDAAIKEIRGRIGAWYVYNDGSATGEQTPPASGDFLPAAGGPNDSGFMALTTGAGFSDWGAGLGFDLNNPGSKKGIWDASGLSGIAFVARGNVAVRVAVVVQGVVSQEHGGPCVPGDGEDEECDDAHGQTVNLGDAWRQYVLPFDQLTQEGWGRKAPFEAATLTGVQFQIPAGSSFEVAIDEIGFY